MHHAAAAAATTTLTQRRLIGSLRYVRTWSSARPSHG
jgi:hypothetical protein